MGKRDKANAAIREKQGRRLTLEGRTMCLSEWARELGISRAALQWRLDSGWPLVAALTRSGRKLSLRRVNATVTRRRAEAARVIMLMRMK